MLTYFKIEVLKFRKRNMSTILIPIVFLLIGLVGFSLYYLDNISQKVELLYKHPYTVSNSVRNIETNIVSMHRYMKDIALSEDQEDLDLARALVDAHEIKVLKNFELVFDRYLGSRSDINSAYQAFISWKIIRNEVINLKVKGDNKQAAFITINKGANHVKILTDETNKLIHCADKKAKNFVDNARESRTEAFIYIIGLLLASVLIPLFLALYMMRRFVASQHQLANRMYLIDQNILIAKMDLDGVIEDISERLCRYLNETKKEMMGKQSNFFIDPQFCTTNISDIYKIAGTKKAWQGDIKLANGHGREQWIDSTVHPNLDSNFNLIGYTNIMQDITDKKEVEILSITDGLTKLNNRRHYNEMIEKEILRARRNDVPLVFTMIDIDFFKKFNDHYGHAAGDNALVRVAGVLKKSLNRAGDYVFRLGGEEFGLLFSDVNIEKAEILLENIRASIEGLRIEHAKSDVNDYLTISIGAVVDVENALGSSDIYPRADKLLYKAKTNRNTVIVS